MDDDALLDTVAATAAETADLDLDELLPRLRSTVQRVLTTQLPDGTWPPPELLGEVLRAHLDLLDERLAAEGLRAADLPGDTRWLDAWRTAAEHPGTLADLLETLRREIDERPVGVPPRIPDDLPVVEEP